MTTNFRDMVNELKRGPYESSDNLPSIRLKPQSGLRHKLRKNFNGMYHVIHSNEYSNCKQCSLQPTKTLLCSCNLPRKMIHYTRLAFVLKRGFVPQTASCTAANENHGARKILRKSPLREIQSANLCTRGVPLLIQRVVGRD